MPTYDYRCPANEQIVEVNHRMSETLSTWGELCETLGIDTGDTPPDSPVERLATGGNVVNSSALSNPQAPACSTGGCCGGGMCGLE